MGVACLLSFALQVYVFILFIRIILSWVTMMWSPPASLGPVIRVIYDLTEPVLGFFRRFIPPVGGFDLSPIVVFLLAALIQGQLGCG
jgi:YggT family protein